MRTHPRWVPVLGLTVACVLQWSSPAHAGDDVSSDTGAEESERATPTPSATPLSEEDELLLKELEQQMQPDEEQKDTAPQTGTNTVQPSPARGAGSSAYSSLYNPAISANALLTADAAYPTPEASVAIQEVEVQLMSNVDPYFLANLILALPEGEGIEVEEGYVQPSVQPFGLSSKIGKIKAPFGRENLQHTHALPFIDKSLVGDAIFGEEGLNEVSVEVSYLTPLPWYTLATVSVLDGRNEVVFDSPRPEDLAGLAGLKSVVDLSDDTTLELGGSFAVGRNADDGISRVAGAHMVVKWKPARAALYHSAQGVVEALYAQRGQADGRNGPETAGLYAYAQYQLARRWYVAGRYDYLGLIEAGPVDRRGSLLLVFAPSEFSALRLQTSGRLEPKSHELTYEAIVQLNFTIGAHPAHVY